MASFFKKCIVFILTLEARAVLARTKPRIIAITGSVGKTTTKDAIYAAIHERVYARKSLKSFNSELGVPLTILGLDNAWSNPFRWLWNLVRGALIALYPGNYPNYLVLEVGADRPGDIRRVASWLKPDFAVFTGVPEVPAHIEYFNSPDDVLKEKRALAEYVRPGGKIIVNGDDERARTIHGDYRGISITYGLESNNDFHASHEEVMYEHDTAVGIRFRANRAASSVPVTIYGALGRPRVYAALAAIAVAECVGVDTVTAAQALAGWEATPGRVHIIAGQKGSLIIDDTYNSSPAAALAALDILADIKTSGRKIAVLGDMLELGRFTKESHRKVGERAAKCADLLITVGFRSRATGEAALDAGMPDTNVREYDINEAERAGDELLRELQPGDVVLVKGSQGMRMEKAVLALMAEPQRAEELLVRMDPDWRMR